MSIRWQVFHDVSNGSGVDSICAYLLLAGTKALAEARLIERGQRGKWAWFRLAVFQVRGLIDHAANELAVISSITECQQEQLVNLLRVLHRAVVDLSHSEDAT